MRKISDVVAEVISEYSDTVFVVTGGCIVHLIDSCAQNTRLRIIPMLHEQSCVYAADAFSRISNQVGVVLATSGPGATNLISGLAAPHFDSIPVVAFCGQVDSHLLKGTTGSRQVGFQEVDAVSMARPVCKYSAAITHEADAIRKVRDAFAAASTPRMGVSLVDFCDNVFRAELESFGVV